MLFSAKGRDFCLVCDCALHATDWSLTTELPPLQKRQTDRQIWTVPSPGLHSARMCVQALLDSTQILLCMESLRMKKNSKFIESNL